jgi:large subunit ribosomal protein L9
MKLILRENVPNVGKIGDLVDVANGYGRNFLLPRKLALLANDRNVKELEHIRRVTAVRLERARVAARGVAERLGGLTITVLKHAGAEGKLYGSVTNREITDLLGDHGFVVDKRDIKLVDPIRTLGEFDIKVELHTDVGATVKLIVEASELSKIEAAQAAEAAAIEAKEAAEAAAKAAVEQAEESEESEEPAVDPFLPQIDF